MAAVSPAGPDPSSVRDRATDGSDSTAARATSPPNECPTRWTGPAPSTDRNARRSAASDATVYADSSSGPADSYCPRWSIATNDQPAADSGAASCAKSSLLPV